MASIMTNASALTALQTLKSVSGQLVQTQDRISTGLKVSTAKDNAAYFSISSTMKADVAAFKSINETLTLTRNAVTVARTGAQAIAGVVEKMVERIAFAQTDDPVVQASVQAELADLAVQAQAAYDQSTFNGLNLLDADVASVEVVTGITRNGAYATTTFTFNEQNLDDTDGVISVIAGFSAASMASAADRETLLQAAEAELTIANTAATELGLAERTISQQQTFVSKLVDELNVGIGAMVDADLNEESTRLQALQVQQQLAIQALSIANQQPQNILSLFR
ncbi:MAG TPA: flagellin [Arenibaculum sp.]|nr:flagellin [Arenibaculum sp.]